ncbi:MAG TPA: GNAT family N-acetyltransferase [Thermoanaerobaculia bacterium]|nr:GNAT family N-acetyltransferase [Thermoanaerobaculia bacterium]
MTPPKPAGASFAVRRAEEGDSAGILECLRLAFEPYREEYTPKGFADTVLDAGTLRGRLKEMSVFVAVGEGGQILGTIGCAAVSDEEGHIRGMAVRPGFQGRGVAARLLEAAESRLAASGCRRANLDTTAPLKRAIRFYEAHGYRASGTIRDFFGMPLYEYVKILR